MIIREERKGDIERIREVNLAAAPSAIAVDDDEPPRLADNPG
jgi:hypothetical protein